MRMAFAALTTRGRAFLAAGTTCAVCAAVLGERDLLRAGILVLALPVVTMLLVNRARYRISCVRSIQPSRVPVGHPAKVTLHLENTGRLPSNLLMLEDEIPYALGTRPRFIVDQVGARWQRSIDYTLRSDVRGRYPVGPLTVRVSDAFGLIEINRSFSVRQNLLITPAVDPLPNGQLHSEWAGTGENRPRAFAAAGTEDVTIREYRHGDDLRRVHWRSTARVGELMVRREEQPWQSRVTLLLDSREAAHRGSGPASSFEWMVSATASIGVHLAEQGFALRLVSESGDDHAGHWHERGTGRVGDTDDLLEELAIIQASPRKTLDLPRTGDEMSGVIVALVGLLSPLDLEALRRLAQGAGAGYAIVADVAEWMRDTPYGQSESKAQTRRTVAELRTHGWQVAVATPQDRVGTLWAQLINPMRGGNRGLPPHVQELEEV
ncbi:MAG: DUF58 domain-containing protein [Propionibacteriales bacterium]|nr:DUF58 domain-containing protein [Propionibacteriales bacterium]